MRDQRGTALTLDASHREGGGQVLRTVLSLAVVLKRPVTITNIRARRSRPGLQPQHLTAVRALAAVSEAEVDGAELHSTALRFVPRETRPGVYRFEIGTAGAVPLAFQALLLPLALAVPFCALANAGSTFTCPAISRHLTTVAWVVEQFLPVRIRLDAVGPARVRITPVTDPTAR